MSIIGKPRCFSNYSGESSIRNSVVVVFLRGI